MTKPIEGRREPLHIVLGYATARGVMPDRLRYFLKQHGHEYETEEAMIEAVCRTSGTYHGCAYIYAKPAGWNIIATGPRKRGKPLPELW